MQDICMQSTKFINEQVCYMCACNIIMLCKHCLLCVYTQNNFVMGIMHEILLISKSTYIQLIECIYIPLLWQSSIHYIPVDIRVALHYIPVMY